MTNTEYFVIRAVGVVPSDTVNLVDGITKGVYVGVDGDLSAVLADGSEFVFKNLAGGCVHPISVKRIKATGTTATSIGAMY